MNNYFNSSFFKFLFGFLVIVALSFGVIIAANVITEKGSVQQNVPADVDTDTETIDPEYLLAD